jgi:hypothetical protein
MFMLLEQGLRATVVTSGNMGLFLSESAYIVYAVSAKDGLPYPGMPVLLPPLCCAAVRETARNRLAYEIHAFEIS